MKNLIKNSLAIVTIVSIFGLTGLMSAQAATTVNLNNASNFAVLAGSTITNTGSSVVNGDIGLSPGTSVTGFPPGSLNGTQQVSNALSIQAKTDLSTAYSNAAGQSTVSTVPTELGGTTKTAGVYDSATGTFGITGTLTLDAQNNPNAIFIFKTSSTFITAGASQIVLANGAQACNVFWQVGSSATLGINSLFKGTILAQTSATLTTGANVEGRVLVSSGAVTLDTNTIVKPTCAVAVVTPSPTSIPTPTPTPLPTVTPVSTPIPTPTPTLIVTPIKTSVAVTPVSVPSRFPNTGIAPDENNVPWSIVMLATSIMVISVSIILTATLRERTS